MGGLQSLFLSDLGVPKWWPNGFTEVVSGSISIHSATTEVEVLTPRHGSSLAR